MYPFRTVPIFEARAQPQSWSDRMQPGEFAVMLADVRTGSPCLPDGTPVLDVNAAPVLLFGSFADAELWSKSKVASQPEMRCRIYDRSGMAGQPVEIRDPRYQRNDGFSRVTSMRIGIGLLGAGLALFAAEFLSDFRLSWAAMIGARLLPVGLLLLVTEAALRLNDWDKRRREAASRLR